jgi:hypothetical protein
MSGGMNVPRRGAKQLQYPIQIEASLPTGADSDSTTMIGDTNSLSREAPGRCFSAQPSLI